MYSVLSTRNWKEKELKDVGFERKPRGNSGLRNPKVFGVS